MAKNNNGKYEFSLRTILAAITLLMLFFGAGGAWVGQRAAIDDLEKYTQENKVFAQDNRIKLDLLKDQLHATDIQLIRLVDAVDRLTEVVEKLESKIED